MTAAGRITPGRGTRATISSPAYFSLAREYDKLLGDLSEATWRSGILAELTRLRTGQGQVVIDLGAGTGIGGRLIGEAGWRCRRIGVDRSAPMLRQAAGHYEATVMADIADLPAGESCADFVVSGFDTLNYLPLQMLRQCLGGAARCLRPGGWLIFDYSSPELLQNVWRDLRYDQQLPDGFLRWQHRYDAAAGAAVSSTERRDAAGNVTWRETHTQYALSTYPLHKAAAAGGLRADRVRDLEWPEFSPAASTHVWVLRKESHA
jgi:SAM-dependent methyltransferase